MAVPVERGPAVRGASPRIVNVILGIWLFISAFSLRTENVATIWNNFLVAIAIFVVSLIPSEAAGPRRPLFGGHA